MHKKTLKNLLGLAAFVLGGVLIKQFCYRQTDGFALHKICSSLPFYPEWECAPPTEAEAEEISTLLDQPFYYMAKGAQAYVFVSEDGRAVIKFFRLYHLRPPLWQTSLSFPQVLQPWRVGKMLGKREELEKDFASYRIAYEEMREETGLVYLHLNKTACLNKSLTIFDKIGIRHTLDLDRMEFLVQRRATLVYPSIEHLMKTEGEAAAKEAISALVRLLFQRCSKGIFDKDPDLNTNFGFLGKRPIQIDIGRFRRDERLADGARDREEVVRITDNLRQWLDSTHPSLSKHLLSEITGVP